MLRDIIEQNEEVKVNSREVQMLKEHFGGCFNNEGKFDLEKFRTMIGDEINIIEVKATTNSKYNDLDFTDLAPRRRGAHH